MTIKETVHKISRGTTEIINVEGLEKKLQKSRENNQPLVIKAGFDPTAPDIHLGHVVLLKKIKQFQDLGHRVLFLIGDFTAQIGDPTGRDQLRKKMTQSDVDKNAQTYKNQVFKVLNAGKTEVVFNSHWLANLTPQAMLELTAHCTVAQMLARADFKKRFDQGREISLLEFIYPLLQGYDSVYLKADIELGGSDQKFNLLMGRQLQEAYGQDPQVVIMTPLLEGTDGIQKMSKSLGNYIGINEPAKEIFGKVMSITDALMYRYYELLTDEDLHAIKKEHPKQAKVKLATTIAGWFHSPEEVSQAAAEFNRVFAAKEIPQDIAEYKLPSQAISLGEILIATKTVTSKNEMRRLLQQGAVTHDGRVVDSEDWKPQPGVLKIGKRRFLKLTE